MKTPLRPRASAPAPPADPPDAAAALLAAARALFVADGLPALSVRRVAEAAGCTTMQVYSRFGGKDGLLRALFDEGFSLLAAAQHAVPLAMPPHDRVRALCRAYLRLAQAHPHHYALMLGTGGADFEPPPDSRQRALATRAHLVDAVRRALTGARRKALSADEVADRLLALCHGQATLAARGLVSPASDAALDRAVDALMGMGSTGSRGGAPRARA